MSDAPTTNVIDFRTAVRRMAYLTRNKRAVKKLKELDKLRNAK